MDDMPDILEQVFGAMLYNVYTATPGIIQSYTAKTKSAVVLPTIKITYADGTIASLPKINHVQVIFPGTQRTVIQYKLEKGDGCLLIFSKQALDNWINSSGDQVADGDSRSFSLTDAFCIPGLFPTKFPGKIGGGTGLEIIHETGKIQFTDDGNIELNGNTKSFVTHTELNNALQTFINALNTHTHSNGNEGSPTGAPLTSMSIDLSNCKTTTILTGG